MKEIIDVKVYELRDWLRPTQKKSYPSLHNLTYPVLNPLFLTKDVYF